MDIDGGLRFDQLIWLTSPRPGEEGWTGRIYEDVESACGHAGLPIRPYEAPNKALFLDALDKIAEAARNGSKPFLHLDMHGSVEKGIEIAASKEFVPLSVNAGFDRKFAERYWPVFEDLAWGCSATEVDWRKHGFAGAQLAYLLNGAGFFHQAHRAVDDCHALLEVLALDLPTTGSPALALLLDTAPKKTWRVWAEQSPFELKDSLKRRSGRHRI